MREHHPLGQRPGDRLGLVVPTSPAPPPVERDRNHHVGPIGGKHLTAGRGQQTAEYFRQCFTRVVLELEDRIPETAVVCPKSHHGVEAELDTPTLWAAAGEVGVRTHSSGAAWAGRPRFRCDI